MRELTGTSLRDVEVAGWVIKMMERLDNIIDRITRMGLLIFERRMYRLLLTVPHFSCNGIEHTVVLSDSLAQYGICCILYPVMCKYLDSYVVPAVLYDVKHKIIPKKYFITILSSNDHIKEVHITSSGFGDVGIYFWRDINVLLPFHHEGHTENVGSYTVVPGMNWGRFAELVKKDYKERFSYYAILNNVEEFILGLVEMLEKYVDGLEDIARNHRKYIPLLQLYP